MTKDEFIAEVIDAVQNDTSPTRTAQRIAKAVRAFAPVPKDIEEEDE